MTECMDVLHLYTEKNPFTVKSSGIFIFLFRAKMGIVVID